MAKQNNIGDQIRDAVQDAINSQDFSKLNETVSKSIGTAADNISRGLKQASENARESARKEQQKAVRQSARYQQQVTIKRKTFNQQWINDPYREKKLEHQQNLAIVKERYMMVNGMKTSGYLMAICGGVLSTGFAVGTIGAVAATLFTSEGLVGVAVLGAMLAGSLGLLTAGVKRVGFASRFQNYIRIIGQRSYCDVKELAERTRKPIGFVLKNVKKMLGKGLFRQGYLDQQESCLMVTNEAYQQYQSALLQLEERKKQEKLLQSIQKEQEKEQQRSAEVQAVLDEGNAYILKIHASNEAIPGEVISQKISRMEMIVRKIFQRVEEHPEVIPDLKKLMEYYLPTTVKLLDAYEELDRQPIQGDNISKSKKEIEDTLDTLNVAFEKLLDSIFRDVAWDVSTDISVLHTILAQEGLTEDGFKL